MFDQQFWFALKLAVALALVAGAILLLVNVWWVMRLIIIAILVFYALNPAVNYLSSFRGLPRMVAVVIVLLALMLLLVLLFNFLIPVIVSELQDLARFIPRYTGDVLPYLEEWGQLLERPEVAEVLQGFVEDLPGTLQEALYQATAFTRAVVTGVAEVLLVLFMVFYLLRDSRALRKSLLRYAPNLYRTQTIHVLGVVDDKVGSYLRGNLIRCTAVGVLTGIVLSWMDVPFASMLGVLAGILNIIVYIGPFLAAIPAVLIALTESLGLALAVAVVYMVVQAIDAFVFTPQLLGRAVNLHPFTVVVAILVGGSLLGVLGIIIGIPLVATLKVLIDYYYRGEL